MVDLVAQIVLAVLIAGFYGAIAQDVWNRVKAFDERED